MIDRRGVMKGAIAGAGAARTGGLGLAAGASLLAATGTSFARDPAVHSFTFGEFEVSVLTDGNISLPISALAANMDAGLVTTLLAERGLPTDVRPGEINVTMLRRGDQTILIDTGSGMNFMESAGLLDASMEIGQIARDEVNHVVLTHAHPDHVWGVIDDFEEAPRFGNADYTIAAAEFDFWMAADRVDLLPDAQKPFALGAQRNLSPVAERMTMATDGHEVMPGVTMVSTPGHTPGHMSVLVQSEDQQLLVTGDAFTHDVIAFERPDWHFGFDMDHAQAAATRQAMLKQIIADDIALIGYHLPWPGIGRVEVSGGGYRYVAGM